MSKIKSTQKTTRKEKLKKEILKLRKSKEKLTLKQIAEKVGLRDKQWVYYHLNTDKILAKCKERKNKSNE